MNGTFKIVEGADFSEESTIFGRGETVQLSSRAFQSPPALTMVGSIVCGVTCHASIQGQLDINEIQLSGNLLLLRNKVPEISKIPKMDALPNNYPNFYIPNLTIDAGIFR